eukprot:CCRYP_011961-RA/>CCRYP_011961-RA protein AED:0.55 eAED:0.80 QI:0/-1/0/1/-1/0/1/0/201
MAMLRTAELDMADTISESDIADFLTNAAWAVCSTYHTVLKTSPGAAIFGRDILFDVPYIADWSKIAEYRQRQTDRNTRRENASRVDWDYQPGDKVLLRKDGILRKTESRYESDPWTIMSVHTNGTIRVQRGTKSGDLTLGELHHILNKLNTTCTLPLSPIKTYAVIATPSFFLLAVFFFSSRGFLFVSIDTLSLHSWGRVT